MRDRRQLETIAGRVNADGSIAAGEGFAIQKTATGTYVAAFGGSFRLVAASASPISTAESISTSAYTGNGVTFGGLNTAGALVDAPFAFIAEGVQA